MKGRYEAPKGMSCSFFDSNIRGDSCSIPKRESNCTIVEERRPRKKALPGFMAQTACSAFKMSAYKRDTNAHQNFRNNYIENSKAYKSKQSKTKPTSLDQKMALSKKE